MRGGDVRDIEALDDVRRVRHAQFGLQREHVLRRVDGGDELPGEALGRLGGALEVVQQVADFGRALEVEPRGSGLHVAFELVEHLLGGAIKKVAGLVHLGEVAGARDPEDARRGAVLDDVLQAMAIIDLGGDVGPARADVEFLAQQTERLAE